MAEKIIGYCKFCGQSRMVEDAAVNVDECATLHCTCEDARKYQYKMQQYEAAKNMIDNYVGADAPIRGLLLDMVKSLQEKTSLKHSVKLNKRIKMDLSITGDGEIKIKRTITDTDEERV